MQTPQERVKTYRLRAEEYRATAEITSHEPSRAVFLRLARDYEVLAEGVEAKHGAGVRKTP